MDRPINQPRWDKCKNGGIFLFQKFTKNERCTLLLFAALGPTVLRPLLKVLVPPIAEYRAHSNGPHFLSYVKNGDVSSLFCLLFLAEILQRM